MRKPGLVIDIMMKAWNLHSPELIIWITGQVCILSERVCTHMRLCRPRTHGHVAQGAHAHVHARVHAHVHVHHWAPSSSWARSHVPHQVSGTLALDPGLEDALTRGLLKLTTSTDAWVMTGGMDSGVMRFAGQAIGGFGNTPCIGVVSLQRVTDGHQLSDEQSSRRRETYFAEGPNGDTVALECHHTHFLLVDTPEVGTKWGGEIELFKAIRDRMSRERHVPLAALVIGGIVGTLEDIHDSLDSR